jgi:hypothetical protein
MFTMQPMRATIACAAGSPVSAMFDDPTYRGPRDRSRRHP